MSTTRYVHDGLSITTFAGPVGANADGSRSMVQITVSGQYVQLRKEQWLDLVGFARVTDDLWGLSEVIGDET